MPSVARVPRRTALRVGVLTVGLGSVATLSGCDLDPREPSTPGPTAGAPTQADPDGDLVILERIRGELGAAVILIESVREARPRLRSPLRQAARLHQAHVEALAGAGPPAEASTTSSATPSVPTSGPAATLGDVSDSEKALLAALNSALVEARSGEFARLLAGIAASTTQVIATLPEGP